MAKLKTKTNQPVVDSEGLLDHIAQEGNTTQIGGNLEVDGNLKVNGDIVTDFKVVEIFSLLNIQELTEQKTLSDGATIGYQTDYTPEQMLNILNKYRYVAHHGAILKAHSYNPEQIGSYNTIEEYSSYQSYFDFNYIDYEDDFSMINSGYKIKFFSEDGQSNYILYLEL